MLCRFISDLQFSQSNCMCCPLTNRLQIVTRVCLVLEAQRVGNCDKGIGKTVLQFTVIMPPVKLLSSSIYLYLDCLC